ncbi:glycine--tRNA ligase subunit beta [Halalkalibacterium ligniniphilum]|uniref:glycine--tRNA ligase subunit beta n=1 Tax=Halalkalibacterium ligniniphilum TaxID=1134413 RepID=UPI00034687CC|nr:glycine--tRNA ligase subunit beta [Halalkalibacterium ligniniphilum]
MSKRDFLLEIGLEELPARFVTSSMNQLKEKIQAWIEEKNLDFEKIEAYSTPRRLAVFVQALAEKQNDLVEEARGPAKKIALDDEGQWTKAAQGFARGQGVSTDDLFFKEVNGVEYAFANKFIKGKQTAMLLPELKELICGLHFPKNMRWNEYDLRFARPIQWLIALYGDEVIPFSITEVETGNKTYGHRFLGEEIEFFQPESYRTTLLGQYVIVDPVERKEAIRNQLSSLAQENGWKIPVDEGLLEEVNNLVEYPTALFGSFDEQFLALPKEVLITSMREHQRYFPVQKEDGTLLPHFVTVRNGDHKHLDNVVRGNEKVLRARLSDAWFFYTEDQKLDLDSAKAQLENIVYHEELGSIGDKVRRIREGAAKISALIKANTETIKTADRIAELCKFDLVTQMVSEFPELQGRMGEVYAEIAGEAKAVAQGIHEHYMPRFSGDKSPASLPGTIVSLADKLDTIITCFAIGLIPTGSQDPYALRRQAAGVVQMLLDHQLAVNLNTLLEATLDVVEQRQLLTKRSREDVYQDLREFFKLRVKNKLQDEGASYDIIDAVLDSETSHLPTIAAKAALLSEKRESPKFKPLVDSLSRVTNIAKKAGEETEVDESLFEKKEERELFELYKKTKEAVYAALEKGDVTEAYLALEATQEAINQYFDNIMVMAENEEVRANRLAQMKAFAEVIHAFAGFHLIVFA